MTADNFDKLFTILTSKQPFSIFTVELVGGKTFEIDHLRALAYNDGVAVFIAPGGYPIMFDHESVLAINGTPASRLKNERE